MRCMIINEDGIFKLMYSVCVDNFECYNNKYKVVINMGN
jgi:hypothetical protein